MTIFFQPEFLKNLVGRTITACVKADVSGDDTESLVFPGLQLDDGSILVIQRDPEGNGGGFMALESKDGKSLGCGGDE